MVKRAKLGRSKYQNPWAFWCSIRSRQPSTAPGASPFFRRADLRNYLADLFRCLIRSCCFSSLTCLRNWFRYKSLSYVCFRQSQSSPVKTTHHHETGTPSSSVWCRLAGFLKQQQRFSLNHTYLWTLASQFCPGFVDQTKINKNALQVVKQRYWSSPNLLSGNTAHVTSAPPMMELVELLFQSSTITAVV